jgi:3-oxoacyl-[acyl-carrier protein] reductase
MSDPLSDAGSAPIAPATCVLVSGGSRGLGLAIVESVLASGAKVATFARTLTPELEKLAGEHPDSVHVDSVDANDSAAVTRFVKATAERLGPIDALVNNAAVGQDSLHVHTSPERIAGIVATNLTAPLLLSRTVLRQILARGMRGRIVFITSVCAQRGYSGLVSYAATKGALEAASRTLAREMHGRALVNCVAPGFFASEMSSVLGSEQLGTIVRRTPSGRLVEPENVVPVVRSLLFDDTNINGQVITIDGGSSI